MGLLHLDTTRIMASADLSWLVIRNSSSFLLKRNRQNLTREPNNLKGKNSFRYSGIVQGQTVGVEPCKDGKGVTLVTRKGKGLRKPRNTTPVWTSSVTLAAPSAPSANSQRMVATGKTSAM